MVLGIANTQYAMFLREISSLDGGAMDLEGTVTSIFDSNFTDNQSEDDGGFSTVHHDDPD